jgi:formylglycine-generating enzyme required for sulfatase activity
VADFELGITEVTQRQFAAFVAATRRTEPGEYCWVRAPIGQPQPPGRWQFPGADPDEPVVCVTQEEAESYAAWLGETTGRRVRLPTSAEWEYAARGGGRPIAYPWGNAWPPPPGAANIADRSVKNATYGDAEALPLTDYDDGARYSMPVASTSPNELGLYDMSGNVWERVGDHADPCIVRGGSWDNASPVLLSTSGKELVGCNKPRTAAMGFRVARDVTR